jgi:hypothetical protein
MDIVKMMAMQLIAQVHEGLGTPASELIEDAKELLAWTGEDEPYADDETVGDEAEEIYVVTLTPDETEH